MHSLVVDREDLSWRDRDPGWSFRRHLEAKQKNKGILDFVAKTFLKDSLRTEAKKSATWGTQPNSFHAKR